MAAILVTNDDGIEAPGLRALVSALCDEHETIVIAPDSPRSAVGHAITIDRDLSLHRLDLDRVEAFALDGTPADCVKLGVTTLRPDCDLVVSGINRGPNVGINVLYSGTVGAAIEGAIQGKPSVALSVDYPEDGGDPDFQPAAAMALRLVNALGRVRGLDALPILNVNFPATGKWRGIVPTRQSRSGFREYYHEDPGGEWPRRFRVDGDYCLMEDALHFDACALKAGYVSVTPLGLDLSVETEADGHHGGLGELLEAFHEEQDAV